MTGRRKFSVSHVYMDTEKAEFLKNPHSRKWVKTQSALGQKSKSV